MASRKVLSPLENNSEKAEEGPPKPARSAFMCFSDVKSNELKAKGTQKNEFIKQVADLWSNLSERERADWAEVAREDKLRFIREKAAYKGPWNIPKRRAKKHPGAPKRPMSAFLRYSLTRRALVKEQNPDMENTDVSRLLGEMWRVASPKEKHPYVEQEENERAVYKQQIADFKAQQARMDAESRTSHSFMSTADYNETRKDPSSTESVNSIYRHQYHQQSHHPQQNSSSHRQHYAYPVHYGYNYSQAPSFDSFVDSISEPQHHLPPLHLSPQDVFFPGEGNSRRTEGDENRNPGMYNQQFP